MSTQPDSPDGQATAEVDTPSKVAAAGLALVQGTLQKFDAVAAGLAELRQKYEGVAFDCTTVKGMGEATAARMACREPRYAVQNALKDAKRPLNDLKSAIDGRAKEIIDAIFAIEDPIDKQIEAELERKKRVKAEKEQAEINRVNAIQERINAIRLIPSKLVNSSSADIQAYVDEVASMEIGDDFEEFKASAEEARVKVLGDLGTMHSAAVQREQQEAQLAAQQEELRRQQEAQRQQEAEARQRRQREQAEHEAQMKAAHDRLAAEQEEVRKANENLEKARAILAAAEAAAQEAMRKAVKAAEERAAAEAQAKAERLQKAAPAMFEALQRIVAEAMEPNIVEIAQQAIAAATEQAEVAA